MKLDKRIKTIFKWSIILIIILAIMFGGKSIAWGFFILVMIARDIVRIYRMIRKEVTTRKA